MLEGNDETRIVLKTVTCARRIEEIGSRPRIFSSTNQWDSMLLRAKISRDNTSGHLLLDFPRLWLMSDGIHFIEILAYSSIDM